MAEEFALSVNVDADMSRFRQTLRQELEAAQKQGATIPVGATAGAAGTSVVPPGSATGGTAHPGGAPTAAAVAQQSAAAVATAAARAAGFAGTIQGMSPAAAATVAARTAPLGRAATVAGGGLPPLPPLAPFDELFPEVGATKRAIANTERSIAQTQAESAMWMGGGAPGGQGRRGAGGGRRRGFISGGEGITGAYLLNAAGRFLENEMNYGSALRAAGSDPEALIKADVEYRQGIGEAFPIAGRLGMAMNDLFTGGTEPIERSLREAERQDTLTEGMRRTGAMQQRFRTAAEAAQLRGSEQAHFLVDAQHRQSLEEIRDVRRLSAEESSAKFRQQRDEVNDWYRRTPLSQGGTPEELNRRMGAVQQAENDALAQRAQRFLGAKADAEAVQQRAHRDIDRGIIAEEYRNEGATRASRLRTQNRPFEASISERLTAMGSEIFLADPANRPGIARRGVQEVAESLTDYVRDNFRDFGRQRRQQEAGTRITQRLLDRDPLGAQIEGISADTEEEVRSFDNRPWGIRQILQGGARATGALRARLATQEETDARHMTAMSVEGRLRVSRTLADESVPLYERQQRAGAESIADEAVQRAEAFKIRGKGYEPQARQELEIGLNNLAASRSAFRAGLRPVEIESLSRTDLGGGINYDRIMAKYDEEKRRLSDAQQDFGQGQGGGQQTGNGGGIGALVQIVQGFISKMDTIISKMDDIGKAGP